MIQDYQDSAERTIAGFIFGQSDRNLTDGQVTAVSRILNHLKMEDYMVLASKVSEEKFDEVKEILGKLGVKEFKGFPTMKESRTVSSRNPMAVHARRRRHGVEDPKKKTDQKDPWARGAKHKDKEMKKVDEAVLGMTDIPMVTRMRELAGIKTPVEPVSEKFQKLRHIRELEDFDDINTFDDSIDNEVGAPTPAPIGAPPVSAGPIPQDDLMAAGDDSEFGGYGDDSLDGDDGMGLNGDLDMGVEPVDDLGMDGMDAPMGDDLGIPSFSSTLPGAAAPVAQNTPAYSSIMSSLDQITAQLKDVKVSEYKEIINRLKSVHQEIRNQGFNYLQESRKRKK